MLVGLEERKMRGRGKEEDGKRDKTRVEKKRGGGVGGKDTDRKTRKSREKKGIQNEKIEEE